MRRIRVAAALMVVSVGTVGSIWFGGTIPMTGSARAADADSRASREREMLRRTQEALRQSQSENADLARGKTQLEQKLKDAQGQLDSLRNSSKNSQTALHTQLQTAVAAEADLTQKLDDVSGRLAALGARQKQTQGELSARDSDLRQVRLDLEASHGANASCEAKNLKLYEYSQELVLRYEKKGVWAALRQKEPVLGIGAVGVQNVVQEYHDKLADQKLRPATQPVQSLPPAAQQRASQPGPSVVAPATQPMPSPVSQAPGSASAGR